jgi:predicted Zn-dependent peptidase
MIEKSTLSNGLIILTDTMHALQSAAVWVNTGSRREEKVEHGISHLLEHMAFKGTEKRSARQIAEEIEDVGGSLNAYTGRDRTVYHARVLKENVGLGFDILGDILLNSVFDPQELEREKSVIYQEIGESEDTPDDILFDYLQEMCYPSQPLGQSILGTRESVGAIQPDMIRSYMGRNYRPDGMILAAAGAVNHQEIVDQAQSLFGGLKAAEHNRPAIHSRWGGGHGLFTEILNSFI